MILEHPPQETMPQRIFYKIFTLDTPYKYGGWVVYPVALCYNAAYICHQIKDNIVCTVTANAAAYENN